MPHSDFATSIDYVTKNTEMKFHNKLNELRLNNETTEIMIAADTIISLDGRTIIEKPQDKEDAVKMLLRYNEFEYHEVQTAVFIGMFNLDMELVKLESFVDITKVYFTKLDEETARAYAETGEPFGKAGGYGIQGQGATLVEKIDGDFYNVWGFPLVKFQMSKFKNFFIKVDQSLGQKLAQMVNKIDVELSGSPAFPDPDGNAEQETPQQPKLSEQSIKAAKNLVSKQPLKRSQTRLINKIEGFFYLTERILLAPYPDDKTIEKMAKHLNDKHSNQYIVYNLSEHKYDNSYFNNSVMEYSFPGLPCPSLDVLFMICSSMQSWLNMDEQNVIVLHCQGTKGRSFLMAACFMAYFYFKEFSGPKDTLKMICQISNEIQDQILYPSQFRYLNYFDEVLHGFIPLNKPLILQRIIMNGIPQIEDDDEQLNTSGVSDDDIIGGGEGKNQRQRLLCAPYIQIFKNGQRLFQTLKKNQLPECYYNKDSCAIFEIGQRVENDILIRFRHFKSNQAKVSMFRATVHTSFAQDNIIRLTKEELDGACKNDQYPNDFFIDLIFTDARNQSNLLFNGSFKGDSKKRKQTAPEEEYKTPHEMDGELRLSILDFEEEERKLMAGSKNLENKDDYWITLSQQLQDRLDDDKTRKRKLEQQQKQRDRMQSSKTQDKLQYYDEEKVNQILLNHNRKSDPMKVMVSPDKTVAQTSSVHIQQISPPQQSNQNADDIETFTKNPFQLPEEEHEIELTNNQPNQNLISVEEQKMIQQMIETPGGVDDDDIVDLDNYLDNLENDSD